MFLANLDYTVLSLWSQALGWVSTTEIAGNSASKNRSSPTSGFGQKGARILLISEVSPSENKSTVGVPPELPALVAAADELKPCVGLGPFGNVISSQGVAERLRAVGRDVDITAVDTLTGESDYRIVMPPLSSQQEAFRRLRELKSRGIDSFVITKGLDAQGLSLGVFSSNGDAEDYRQTLIGLGYEVVLDVLPRFNRSYWVQISQGMFPDKLLSEVAAEFFEVEVTETGCMN